MYVTIAFFILALISYGINSSELADDINQVYQHPRAEYTIHIIKSMFLTALTTVFCILGALSIFIT